ncbi:zincin-like metallopeptidase domain-containing protein [Marinobacter sp.]|uniref:zincin-like metallopeptidase domain-containing protein n=1 Tax=Marinobacter sp. TaxID=50741 RepID=UPI003A93DC8E
MALTKSEAQNLTRHFVRDYPGALELAYRFRHNTAELYGRHADKVPASMKGGYVSKETTHNGRVYRGRIDIPLENLRDPRDLLMTLRHEVLGHYGANTFAPNEKRGLLDGLIAARNEPGIKPLWESIDQLYSDRSLDVRAEEVFALHSEGVAPDHHVIEKTVERGQQSFLETCIDRTRLMQAADLNNIACMVAQGLHDRTRTQQTFPNINELQRRDSTMRAKKPFHEVVAEKLIEQLKAGTAPWQRPWNPGEPNSHLPMNPTTNKRYKGINAIYLMAQGRSDARWMTYKQALAVDAQVRKGEKGTPVQYWKFSEEQTKVDKHGKPVFDAEDKPVKETVMLERPRVFFATVFNAEQIDGLPPVQQKTEQQWNAVERAEHILNASGAKITHVSGNRAFYQPSTDSITMPERSQFESADRYYATTLHELAHWTGHPSRLDRDLSHPFGSEGYAKEELCAEIASMILGDELGIGHDPDQHVAYVDSWIKVLQDDPLEVFRASANSEKVHDYVLAFEQTQIQEQNQQEVAIVEALAVDIREVLNDSDVTFNHFEAYHGDSLEQALQDLGFTTVGSVTGHDPDNFLDTALARLSPVFGIPLDHNDVDNPYLERKGLAQVFLLKAEQLHQTFQQCQEAGIEMKAETEELQQGAAEIKSDSIEEKSRHYINVPYKEKDSAKQLGARWDRLEQSWYVPEGVDPTHFAKWASGAIQGSHDRDQTQSEDQRKQYLAVPYGERGAAKAAGAVWDKNAKSWYVGPNGDMERLSRWMPDNVKSQQGPAMSPREEFAEAMKSLGCEVTGEHPIMDGKKHRIRTEGDKKGVNHKSGSGFYVGHLDGHPAGYILNNRTGVDMKWKSKGYTLDPAEKAKLQALAVETLAARAVELEKTHEATAKRVCGQAASLLPVIVQTPYMQNKGIRPQAGVLTDSEGKTTYVPAYDEHGKQWTMQYIKEDGTKRFARDSRKEGCFHIVGGDMKALEAAPALVLQEGYSTAATNAEVLGHVTVAAFDAGNLPNVAKALHEKFPDKPVVIFGDNDRHQELTQGTNPGKSKALEAAKAVGGKAVFPVFAPGEADYPNGLSPITPQRYRDHLRASKALETAPETHKAKLQKALLSNDQMAALSHMKKHTDFNDLATNSRLGRDGVERQIRAAVSKAGLEMERKREQKQVEQQVHKQKRSARI